MLARLTTIIGIFLLVDCDRVRGTETSATHHEPFTDLKNWVVEQQPGGEVKTAGGRLLIHDKAGCSVWFRLRLQAPLKLAFTAKPLATGRVSDLNCFWLAQDPSGRPLFTGDQGARDGRFSSYDSLRTYYVGYGGNANTTTRFRRYSGTGARPLLPEHDLTQPEPWLRVGESYRVLIEVTADGEVTYTSNGKTYFRWKDPDPLKEGWFAFRTVDSHWEISEFSVQSGLPAGSRSGSEAPPESSHDERDAASLHQGIPVGQRHLPK